jgi:hypothetical protein
MEQSPAPGDLTTQTWGLIEEACQDPADDHEHRRATAPGAAVFEPPRQIQARKTSLEDWTTTLTGTTLSWATSTFLAERRWLRQPEDAMWPLSFAHTHANLHHLARSTPLQIEGHDSEFSESAAVT